MKTSSQASTHRDTGRKSKKSKLKSVANPVTSPAARLKTALAACRT
jgi:hypothetical protein